MKTWGKVILAAIGTAVVYEAVIHLREIGERHTYYKKSREYCNQVGKKLLRIGMRRHFTEPPNPDVTLDIDPAVLRVSGGVLGDERDMPFADKEFGVCYNEHTLEHLHNVQDVELAVNESVRVADIAILLAPSPYGIYASLFCPTHNLRLWFDQESKTIKVAKNKYRTGIGFIIGPRSQIVSTKGYSQVLVLDNQNEVSIVPI